MRRSLWDEFDAFLVGMLLICLAFGTCGLIYLCTPKYKPHQSTIIYPFFHKLGYFDSAGYDGSYPVRKIIKH